MKLNIQTKAVWGVEGDLPVITLGHQVWSRTDGSPSLWAVRGKIREDPASLGAEAGEAWSTSLPQWQRLGPERERDVRDAEGGSESWHLLEAVPSIVHIHYLWWLCVDSLDVTAWTFVVCGE